MAWKFPFVTRRRHERNLLACETAIAALRGQVKDLTAQLAEARKNDQRDPETGRFVKGGETSGL